VYRHLILVNQHTERPPYATNIGRFYCALLTLHVSAPIGGHLQVVYNTKYSKTATVYVNGYVEPACIKANAVVR
jgi:hypothetical protein